MNCVNLKYFMGVFNHKSTSIMCYLGWKRLVISASLSFFQLLNPHRMNQGYCEGVFLA